MRTHQCAQLIHHHHVEYFRGGHGQRRLRGGIGQRQYLIAACKILRHHLQGIGVSHHIDQINRLLPNGARHGIAHRAFGGEPKAHHQASERDGDVALFRQHNAQLIG